MAHAVTPATQEAETEGSQVQGQAGLKSKTLKVKFKFKKGGRHCLVLQSLLSMGEVQGLIPVLPIN